MHVATDHQIEAVSPTATAVHDQHSPGVRIRYGMGLYLSLDVAEAVDLADALTEALAELEQPAIIRDEAKVRAAAEVREELG